MEEELRELLRGETGISGLVGERVDWGVTPQGTAYPNIVLNTVGGAEGMTMQGPDGLFMGMVQVDCYGETYASAKTVSRAVIAVLNGYRADGFKGVFLASTRDSRDGGTNEAERPFRVSLDFNINWRQTNG
ncbi:DUF3168 domain-containing protein [Pseudooceanicola sp. C21-150M6]|uniref:DUF3168 domain-containing protein n=1 Tax=Pseudooceanicola sp. C21-150M6 TaxID=3434355 RepID=UPI003D7FA3BA